MSPYLKAEACNTEISSKPTSIIEFFLGTFCEAIKIRIFFWSNNNICTRASFKSVERNPIVISVWRYSVTAYIIKRIFFQKRIEHTCCQCEILGIIKIDGHYPLYEMPFHLGVMLPNTTLVYTGTWYNNLTFFLSPFRWFYYRTLRRMGRKSAKKRNGFFRWFVLQKSRFAELWDPRFCRYISEIHTFCFPHKWDLNI